MGTKSTALVGGVVGDDNPGAALVVSGVVVGEVTSANVVPTAPSAVASPEL
jgi:hypothetical protein